MSRQQWFRREGTLHAALARIARVGLKVEVVIRRVQEIVVGEEEEGEEHDITGNKFAAQPNRTPEQWHRRVEPEQGSRDLDCLQ